MIRRFVVCHDFDLGIRIAFGVEWGFVGFD